MSALNEILKDLRIRGSVYFCDLLSPPWQLEHSREQRALFHFVRRGRCVLKVHDESVDLLAGDFVFVSPNTDHRVIAHSGDASDTLLMCGFCLFDADEGDLLLRDLPPYIVIRQETIQEWPWLGRTLEHLSAEYMSDAPGTELTVDKLSEILMVQLLRSEFGLERDAGIIAALRDKRLARALDAIHDDLSYAWTIEKAAEKASMSRSGFARIFSQKVGVSFYEYLTKIRIKRAQGLLVSTTMSIADVGARVGYQSDLSFVKVFKKNTQVTPHAFRQASQSL